MTEAPALSEPTLEFTVERRTDPLPDEQREAVLANPGFGKTFTDHMVLATWTRGPRGGTTAGSRHTGPSPSSRPRRSCTTRRRSSRA